MVLFIISVKEYFFILHFLKENLAVCVRVLIWSSQGCRYAAENDIIFPFQHFSPHFFLLEY